MWLRMYLQWRLKNLYWHSVVLVKPVKASTTQHQDNLFATTSFSTNLNATVKIFCKKKEIANTNIFHFDDESSCLKMRLRSKLKYVCCKYSRSEMFTFFFSVLCQRNNVKFKY